MISLERHKRGNETLYVIYRRRNNELGATQCRTFDGQFQRKKSSDIEERAFLDAGSRYEAALIAHPYSSGKQGRPIQVGDETGISILAEGFSRQWLHIDEQRMNI